MSNDTSKAFKSGFVNIVGNPNVGKSTLMNKLVGDKVSIITNKSQTTRHRIIGIVNTPEMQIVYSDTPGVLKPSYKMQEEMLGFSKSALSDADVLLYVTDTVEDGMKNAPFVEAVQRSEAPLLVLINKADLGTPETLSGLVSEWQKIFPKAIEVLPIAAEHNAGITYIKERVEALLPENPPYFDQDAFTDRPARFFVNEIIREKIFLYYQQEVPYSTEVEVEEFHEGENLIKTRAIIFVERESQKGIIIGKGGAALKKVGMMARRDLEKFFEKKIFLELIVRVEKDWRNRESALEHFGYKID